MDLQKFMTIAHSDHRLCSPLSPYRIERIIPMLNLSQGARVLDIGCSKAEMLIQMAERCQIQGTGIDIAEEFIRAAQEAIDTRTPGADINLHCVDIHDFELDEDPYDVIICIGSTHLYGGFTGALEKLKPHIRHGGYLITADLFWKTTPTPVYLNNLGIPENALAYYPHYITMAQDAGYTPLYSLISTEDEWDDYEWMTYRAIEGYVRTHLEDSDVPAMLEKTRSNRDRYLKWGRETMGFGLYLLQN